MTIFEDNEHPGWFLCVNYTADSNGKVSSERSIITADNGDAINGIRGFTKDPQVCVNWSKDGKLP